MVSPRDRRRVSSLTAEAFVFTYPLVVMALTCRRLTTGSAGDLLAPMNQFAHLRHFPSAPFSPVVTPNRDALYSSAWLDLSSGPLLLSLPRFGSRFVTMPIYDAWTHVFAVPNSRTLGTTGTRSLVILGPHSSPIPPSDVPTLHSPTDMAWILGRIQTDGPADYPTVHAIQDELRIRPFGDIGSSGEEPSRATGDDIPLSVSTPTARLTRMEAQQYFGMAARLMAANPPKPEDEPVVTRMGRLGMVPGRPPSGILTDPSAAPDVVRGMREGMAQIEAAGGRPPTIVRRHWVIPRIAAQEAHDYLVRAGAAWTGLGMMPPAEAFEATTTMDAESRHLAGEHRYVIHFSAEDQPPVRAFWSLAVHQSRLLFLDVPRRESIGNRDALRLNTDGTLDIYLQHEDPGQPLTANWLPTPRAAFGLVLRLYWPLPPARSGIWSPPPVVRQD